VRYQSLSYVALFFFPYPLDKVIVLKQSSKTRMFPVLSRVLKNRIPKHRGWLFMTGLRFFPLFLIAEIESEDIFSDAGTVYNPSSFRYPSSLLIHLEASFYQNYSRD